jgi:glutathione gamma-glutamylcysteinyltransferase
MQGYMASFFPLSEQFVTQSEPSFCALSSLAMVLNALNHDPKKIWKGVWRWVSEETLECEPMKMCGNSLDKIKKIGMNFDEFESYGRCHGVNIQSYRTVVATPGSVEESNQISLFRSHVEASCRLDTADQFIVTNFSRKYIGQTGDGHFSPIGGYHPEKDLILIMDVARFKYPPFWVSLPEMWRAMSIPDKLTNIHRGYFLVSSYKEVEKR